MRSNLKILLTILVITTAISGCGSKQMEPIVGDVNTLYTDGYNALNAGDYFTAINTFEELERQHPYSIWATRAQMMMAYAHMKAGNTAEAVVSAERFIRLHPGHKDLAYVYYIRGLAYYQNISDVGRDQGATRQAKAAFEDVINRFPDSEYAQDARQKLLLCNDHLAGKEMSVGRYYQKEGHYLASIKRFERVVAEYQTSSQTPEALFRLTESYVALGVKEEAQRSAAILGHNYPGSAWYKKAYSLLRSENYAPEGAEDSWFKKFKDSLKK